MFVLVEMIARIARITVCKQYILISSVISIFMFACWNALMSPAICSGRIILFISPMVFEVSPMALLNATFAPIALFWKPTLVILLFAAKVRFFCFRTCINCLANNVQASLFPSLAAFLISISFCQQTYGIKTN